MDPLSSGSGLNAREVPVLSPCLVQLMSSHQHNLCHHLINLVWSREDDQIRCEGVAEYWHGGGSDQNVKRRQNVAPPDFLIAPPVDKVSLEPWTRGWEEVETVNLVGVSRTVMKATHSLTFDLMLASDWSPDPAPGEGGGGRLPVL